jgi:signal transduction histidine kinase
MRRVVINLIENAIDALTGSNGNALLSLALTTNNGNASLCVRDNGPGVSEETLARLFEPFFSLKDQGTGLGLAIAKRTVEAHGGQIRARATNGGGLTFEIDLPLAPTKESDVNQ